MTTTSAAAMQNGLSVWNKEHGMRKKQESLRRFTKKAKGHRKWWSNHLTTTKKEKYDLVGRRKDIELEKI